MKENLHLMCFTDNIKKARSEKGWSQEQAAIELGIRRHNLGAYEEGRSKPPLDALKKIVDAYGITREALYEFLFGTATPSRNNEQP